MRRLVLLLLLMPLLCLSCKATAKVPAAGFTAPVTLPVEVLGPDGTTASATFGLPGSVDPASVHSVWLQVHGLSYAGKADIQINGGAWVSLSNTTSGLTIAQPGLRYGGIGGAFSVLKMNLTTSAIVAGSNTITWRMNHTDYVSIGFRVLKFNLQDVSGNNLLPDSAFVNDDPNTWVPPLVGGSGVSASNLQISAGRTLWYHAVLKQSSLSVAPNIMAHCTDCHAEDGRDLKYFNYSNKSIIGRSVFHGLSTVQGVQIASYIRALKYPNPGRPWNPPYQPGPGIDSAPVTSWAAGAGVDAVLDDDQQMIPLIFPGSVITASAVPTTGTLSFRELQVPFQLPDWNGWLPRIHPKDAWGSTFTNSMVWTLYGAIKADLVSVGGAGWTANNNATPQVYQNLSPVGRRGAQWDGAQVAFFTARKAAVPLADWTPTFTEQLYSTALWRNVKMWEIAQANNLEGQGLHTYGATTAGHANESRTWYSQQFFYSAPGIIGIPTTSILSIHAAQAGGSSIQNTYFTNVWYINQLIANAGERHQNSTGPVDYRYYQNILTNMDRDLHTAHALLITAYYVKRFQGMNNGVAYVGIGGGWDPGNVGDPSIIGDAGVVSMWSSSSAATKTAIMETIFRLWLTNNQLFTPSQFYAHGATSSGEGGSYPITLYGKTSYIIHTALVNNCSAGLVSDLRTWATTIWPGTDWASVH